MRLSFDKNSPEVPEPEDSDPKEVYAFFGLCAFHAQVLEQGLINLVVGLKTRGLTQITEVDIIKAFDRMQRKTLGILLNDIRKRIDVPREIDDALSTALEDRNYLIHRFFVHHDVDFLSIPGCIDMIEELRKIDFRFQETDRLVDSITLPLWADLGITQEIIESEIETLMHDADLNDLSDWERPS